MDSPSPQRHEFDSTRWSLIEVAGGEEGSKRRIALENLLTSYMPALHTYLVYRRRINPHQAEDLLHDFVTEKILQGNLLNRADHSKGRFRSLLVTSLNHFLVDRYRHTRATDAVTPGARSLDELGSADPDHPFKKDVDIFKSIWARNVLVDALSDLKESCADSDKQHIWSLFEERLLAPLLWGDVPTPYEDLVDRLGFDSAAQASNAFITAKRQFRRALLTRLGPYVTEESALDGEVRELKKILTSTDQTELDLPEILSFAARQLDLGAIQRLAGLLNWNEDEHSPWSHEQLAALFEHQLKTPLCVQFADVSPRPTAGLLSLTSDQDKPITTLEDLLKHPSPPIEVLRSVKDWATYLMRSKSDKTPPQIAPIVYLTAVAVALVRCEERISSSADTDLEATFRQALEATWAGDQVRQIFRKALDTLG
ncbi:MAG: hypothetical protein CMJ62_12165 [Planctomycetaceae bacterium]|nr:hypothetical protein [Planctomycetaceae bacterium]